MALFNAPLDQDDYVFRAVKTGLDMAAGGRALEKELEKLAGKKVGFGIGTYLSNDCGLEPLNQVMKVIECNGRPVAKISDTEGKLMCRDAEYVARLKSELDWRLTHG